MSRRVVLVLLLVLPGCPAQAQTCPAPPAGEAQRSYRNERFGVAFDYPPILALDPESVPPRGDSARFWSADRRSTVVLNIEPNPRRLALRELMTEAEGDIRENGRGEITYRRNRTEWFVLSGVMAGRIFYRRTMLLRSGRVATLWMEFPRELRPCLDGPVTTMSLSFREIPSR